MDVKVTLLSYGRSFRLPKEWIRTELPSSVLTSALEDEPEATNIDIPNKDVSPDVMLLLARLSRGVEPEKHNPGIEVAHRYLNIPSLLYYADPLYDRIPDRKYGGNPANKNFILHLIRNDKLYPYAYLAQKGYVPTDVDFKMAIDVNAKNIAAYLLQPPYNEGKIDPTVNHNEALREAARDGKIDIVRLLLADPRVDPNDYMFDKHQVFDKTALGYAVNWNRADVVKLLLNDPRVDPNIQKGRSFETAVLRHDLHDKLLGLFLASPRTDPTINDNEMLKWAARCKQRRQLERLLADARIQRSLSLSELTKYEAVLVEARRLDELKLSSGRLNALLSLGRSREISRSVSIKPATFREIMRLADPPSDASGTPPDVGVMEEVD